MPDAVIQAVKISKQYRLGKSFRPGQRTFRETLHQPDMAARLDGLGYEVIGGTPDELRAFYQQEYRRFAELVKAAGIVPE